MRYDLIVLISIDTLRADAIGAHPEPACVASIACRDRSRPRCSMRWHGTAPISRIAFRPRPTRAGPLAPKSRLALATAVLRARKHRARHFPDIEFGEPCWDMMLDLYVAGLKGHQISTSSLCIVAGVPTSTAMRCINVMLERGHLMRWRDPKDGRRWFVRLSPTLVEAIGAWLDEYSALIAAGSIPGFTLRIGEDVGGGRATTEPPALLVAGRAKPF